MKRFIFAASVLIGSLNAMSRVQNIDEAEILIIGRQLIACSIQEHAGCAALRNFLEIHKREASCDSTCRATELSAALCEFALLTRNTQIAQHLHLVHNIGFDPASQCQRFLERIADH